MSIPDQEDFERLPGDPPLDETDVALRAYLARLPLEHLAAYDPGWPDETVMAWDGNFRSDGALMLVCCERDVDVQEFRSVLERHRAARMSSAMASRVQLGDGSIPRTGTSGS